MERKLEKITIITFGSRGDIQPYVALAIALNDRGYQVRFVSNVNFQNLVESFPGITFVGCVEDSQKALSENPDLLQAQFDGRVFSLLAGIASSMKEHAPKGFRNIVNELTTNPPDLIVKGSLSEYTSYYAAIELNIPFVHIPLVIVTHNPKRCLFGFPTLPFGLHKYLITHGLLRGLYQGDRIFDTISGKNIFGKYTVQHFIRDAMSPSLPKIVMRPSLGTDLLYGKENIPSQVKFVGNAIIPMSKQAGNPNFSSNDIQKAIQAFLDKHSSNKGGCIYLGWGSMVSKSAEYMTEFAVQSLKRSGQAGIVLAGYSNLSMDKLSDPDLIQYARDNVLFVKSCSHEWLFPKVKLTVHHGGAGTTAAALRSGKPTIITPVLFDQWDNAYLVNNLGIGIGFEQTQLQQTSAEQLGDAIAQVLSDNAMLERAEKVGIALKDEDGARDASIELEHFWNDYVVTGKFQKLFPGEDVPSFMSGPVTVAAAIGVLSAIAGVIMLQRKSRA